MNITFGRYRLVEQLGEGGMGVVYRASASGPEGFSRALVIKRMRPDLARDRSFVSMLLHEARLSALLHHPNIVQVYELGESNGEYFIAMEYVAGLNLSTVFRRAAKAERAMPPGLVCYVVAQVADALAYAHALTDEQGKPLEIVHRDISPSNIMLTDAGAVKLLDFGIAKAAMEVRDEHTRSGTLKGKIGYMSPEQVEAQSIDGRADLFSLGVVMHECLVGRRLFRGTDDLHTLKLVREAHVLPPSHFQSEISPELDALVLRLLAKDPVQRFGSAEELLAALRPLVHRLEADGAALRSYLREISQAIPDSKDEEPAVERHTSPFAPPANGSRRWLLLAIGVGVASLAAALFAFHRHTVRAASAEGADRAAEARSPAVPAADAPKLEPPASKGDLAVEPPRKESPAAETERPKKQRSHVRHKDDEEIKNPFRRR